MKVRATLRKICASCKMVRRGRKLFVICSASTRHKQRQGMSTLAGPDGGSAAPVDSGAPAGGAAIFAALPYLGVLSVARGGAVATTTQPAALEAVGGAIPSGLAVDAGEDADDL
jgi:large subunit ribosomal protein L36